MTTTKSAQAANLKPETQNWLGLAKESYDDALYMFAGARHPSAVYFIGQAIEKILKAAQAEINNQVPKKIHNLKTLGKQSGLNLSEEQVKTLKDLNNSCYA